MDDFRANKRQEETVSKGEESLSQEKIEWISRMTNHTERVQERIQSRVNQQGKGILMGETILLICVGDCPKYVYKGDLLKEDLEVICQKKTSQNYANGFVVGWSVQEIPVVESLDFEWKTIS